MLATAFAMSSAADAAGQGAGEGARQAAGRAFTESIAGTVVTFDMMPVPAGTVQRPGGAPEHVRAFAIMRTEVTWDLYDIYVFELDRRPNAPAAPDAVARPSKPYVLPGDSYGHKGHPALGMSFLAAKSFAAWLSAKTGRTYRVPTDAEWMHACTLGLQGAAATAPLGTVSWYADNANDRTHPVATLAADALGLHDMRGNAAEWVIAGADSVVMGGGFTSEADAVGCTARRPQTPAWNVSDPQLPKSRWWLTDAFFVGLRLIADEQQETR